MNVVSAHKALLKNGDKDSVTGVSLKTFAIARNLLRKGTAQIYM